MMYKNYMYLIFVKTMCQISFKKHIAAAFAVVGFNGSRDR